MGTLYDLLGALPSDDAEGLRTAFRKAAKTTHPDVNADNPDAAVKFRELVRAYDILTDGEQRTTYDQLLAIALKPPVSKSTRIYEAVRKFASNTVAATIISGVLVGGYTLFGQPSKPPGVAEIAAGHITSGPDAAPAATATTPQKSIAQDEPRMPRERADVSEAATSPAINEDRNRSIARIEPVSSMGVDSFLVRYDPGLPIAYIDRDLVMYRTPAVGHAFDDAAPVKHVAVKRPSKVSVSAPRKPPLDIVPPQRAWRVWSPMVAAVTP